MVSSLKGFYKEENKDHEIGINGIPPLHQYSGPKHSSPLLKQNLANFSTRSMCAGKKKNNIQIRYIFTFICAFGGVIFMSIGGALFISVKDAKDPTQGGWVNSDTFPREGQS